MRREVVNHLSSAARPTTPVRAERFRSALQTRILGRAGLGDTKNFRALILEKGDAILRGADDSALPLSGPVMGWFPWKDGMRLELAAGAQGIHLLLGVDTLERVMARRAEAGQLALMAERPTLMRLANPAERSDMISECFSGIVNETLRPGPMSSAVVESFLHILLVHLPPSLPLGAFGDADTGGLKALAGRFTALIEGHFREQWTIANYAEVMGMSRDRLNDISLRAHGRPPARLIRERLALEARIYLESSSLSLGQIAGVLGFSGASQFNRFFKALQGCTPGRYRSDLRRLARSGGAARNTVYAWP